MVCGWTRIWTMATVVLVLHLPTCRCVVVKDSSLVFPLKFTVAHSLGIRSYSLKLASTALQKTKAPLYSRTHRYNLLFVWACWSVFIIQCHSQVRRILLWFLSPHLYGSTVNATWWGTRVNLLLNSSLGRFQSQGSSWDTLSGGSRITACFLNESTLTPSINATAIITHLALVHTNNFEFRADDTRMRP